MEVDKKNPVQEEQNSRDGSTGLSKTSNLSAAPSFTAGPWETSRHLFAKPPWEGELEEEWGVYPPLGETGPVALVTGEANARLIAAAPALYEVLVATRQILAEHEDHKALWIQAQAIDAALALASTQDTSATGDNEGVK